MKTKNNERFHPEHQEITISSVERRWLLYLLDILAVNGGFVLSLYFREDYFLSWQLLGQHPVWFLLLNGLWFFLGNLFQVYNIENAGQKRTAFIPIISAGFLTIVIFNFIPYLPPLLPPSRLPLFLAILLPNLFLLVGRLFFLLIFAGVRFRKRLIILGAGWAGRTIFRVIHEHARTYYEVVGFVDDDPKKRDQVIEISQSESGEVVEQPYRTSVVGSSPELMDLLSRYRVTTIVQAITQDVGGELYQVLTDCLQMGIEVIPMPLLYEELTGKVPVEHIGDHWSVAMPLVQPGTQLIWHAAKRLFDLFWASIGLLILGILFPLIVLAIKLDSPGPIFYKQKRMGRNGKFYEVYKFRSMVPDAENDHAVWASENDSRVTKVGRFLRRTHIDEFPQFWNILIGEMSAVGPRPERPEFIDELSEEIPFYRVRLAVKPGMAGWGLINQGYGSSVKDSLEKLQYDLYYIKHQSFWLDIYILWKTVIDAITLKGR